MVIFQGCVSLTEGSMFWKDFNLNPFSILNPSSDGFLSYDSLLLIIGPLKKALIKPLLVRGGPVILLRNSFGV